MVRQPRVPDRIVECLAAPSGDDSRNIGARLDESFIRGLLGKWREVPEVPPECYLDTFGQCGNLFAAAIPINLDRAMSDGQLNAGDFPGAASVHWGGRN